MQATTELKEAIEKTFEYLFATTDYGDRKRLRKKLLGIAPGSVIQVIDPRTFSSINDLKKVYVCDAKCNAFFTDTQFRRAWCVITGKQPSLLRFEDNGETFVFDR